eukprot:TRINITY_DN19085_c0_g1_i1.p1 TRINITY_DN19085_c0_g1~~TRINITY_DN19085_c0_g1_i1.p1  ORF type:complete len:219 (-),score=65.17 TRINITY_DN19085_c0_g1_i1:55-711(-)
MHSVSCAPLEQMLAHIRTHASSLVCIGEVGLDYQPRVIAPHGDDEVNADGQPMSVVRKAQQLEVFRAQARLAKELDLAVNVHSRCAGKYAIALLREEKVSRAVLHAFDGKASYAKAAAEQHGYFFSIPPCIDRSPQFQKLVAALPITSILLETDSPALPPIVRERNVPANLMVSVDNIARIKKLSREQVLAQTNANAQALFGHRFAATPRNTHGALIR